MTLDSWLILACGLMFLAIPLGLLIADRLSRRRTAPPRVHSIVHDFHCTHDPCECER